MSDWRVARSLVVLRDQVNARWPNRDRSSDGTIGDASHMKRKSDHDPNGAGVVCAMDITHDPFHGPDCGALVESLRKYKDARIGYLIWNRQISNPDIEAGAWRPYSGLNPHDHHCHISVKQIVTLYDDTRPWRGVYETDRTYAAGVAAPPLPTLKENMQGDAVTVLQYMLKLPLTGKMDEETMTAVKNYQTVAKLVSDGIVGPYTWGAIVREAVAS